MAGATIQVDSKAVLDGLNDLLKASGDLTPALNAIGEVIHGNTTDRFAQQVDPFGNPWQPLDSKTVKRKEKNKDKILVQDGWLSETSLSYQVQNNELEYGNDSEHEYAATHQFGDDSRGISARPFLGFTELDEQMALDAIADHLTNSLQ